LFTTGIIDRTIIIHLINIKVDKLAVTTKEIIISGDIHDQLLGLTEQHIVSRPQVTQQNKRCQVGIHKLMLPAFKVLKNEAETQGIELTIASGFRSFERQLNIWNNKFSGKAAIKDAHGNTIDISKLTELEIINAILLYSALPGASRHHWGCDIDVYAPNLLIHDQPLQLEPWEYETGGPMEKLSFWLKINANKFGFFFPYDLNRGGISVEPWHLSFAPIACQYQNFFKLDALKKVLSQTDILGKAEIINNLSEIYIRFINNTNPYNFTRSPNG